MRDWDEETIIEEILKRTLEELYDWQLPSLMPGIGPQHPEVHFEYNKRMSTYRSDVSSMLRSKSIDELRRDYLVTEGSTLNPLTKRHGIHFKLVKDLERLKKSIPPWFGSGWSEKSHLLEADYWVAATTVEIREAALMLVGVDPRRASFDTLFKAYGFDQRTDEILYFLDDYFDLLVRRFGELADPPIRIRTEELYAWVADSGLKVSVQFEKLVDTKLGAGPGSRSKFGDKNSRKLNGGFHFNDQAESIHGNTRSMFQKALTVMALDKYNMKTSSDAGIVAKAIVSAGDFRGFNLDKRTLVNQLRAGFELYERAIRSDD